ncbi:MULTISPECIES: hypothetical protein [unclassified Polaribacter]|uniref:hypothetical protein n=1 Tax=unclassified Polaribacter TaxID=196858 RepID=UPI0011BF2352|nr:MULTISPECIES: hypothetical protein [unclassified Polaribacter]TXD52649.1 hypothetical protein ES043_07355 [Polaribacter sp. IC063]TXD60618.1 hypothetical protein ES044_06890 [Polaribacter sp. IC066]
MVTIKIHDDILQHCKKQVENYNFGQRFTANGTKQQQLTGIIGQSTVMQIFNQSFINGSEGFDNGIDMLYNNLKIDIKTMGRTTDVRANYTNNFLKLQDYFETEIYIFCSHHKNKQEITICGWIDKEEFIRKRKLYPKGSIRKRFNQTTFKTFADLYEIENHQLNDILSVDDLKEQLNNFKK